MLENLTIINARVPGYTQLQRILTDDRGSIARIKPMEISELSATETLDVGGDWMSLGGVDLQINGALGLAFTDVERADLPKLGEICRFLGERGVDGFLPTLVTTSVEKIGRSLSVFAELMAGQSPEEGAQILGVHLEGPFLNPQKRGAHPAEYLLPLTVENVKRVLGDYAEVVKVMTLAPELEAGGEAIAYLRSLGITVSLGHSLATAADAHLAFDRGATMVTHAFNAMPGLHHREPGLLGAAIARSGVRCGFIADGEHVCPTMLQILLAAGQGDRGLFLVSDALAPLGLPDGVYPWDSRQIEVKNGTARLPDGTLSGTTLPLLAGVENLVNWGICEVDTAIALATISPRRAIGIEPWIGQRISQLLRWKQGSGWSWKRVFK
ncbi:MAG TPA: N-acetylglucosamine-6-phosphate deacetylase [Oscillatoriales cyanobacterium M59_W2019_021]|nr:N-acetylglucosamine-6-phosphate deacetylase [Oscillatoriales cyanobacterium M4454_W2019_049]HIK52353.1 N-acetylglucosamine-6-phosphate deacetylase [Oscillatoriales cyanobacterium M59_W2019_021]